MKEKKSLSKEEMTKLYNSGGIEPITEVFKRLLAKRNKEK